VKTGEQLLRWDPIPSESNVYMEVGVFHVEELAVAEGTPLAVILVARRRHASDGAWRLLFQRVTAYRRLPVEAYAGAHLISLRDMYEKHSLPTPATFEVVRSSWLQTAVSRDYGHPQAVRHFVVTASDVAYDIAAEWCDVEDLGDAERACAGVRTKHSPRPRETEEPGTSA